MNGYEIGPKSNMLDPEVVVCVCVYTHIRPLYSWKPNRTGGTERDFHSQCDLNDSSREPTLCLRKSINERYGILCCEKLLMLSIYIYYMDGWMDRWNLCCVCERDVERLNENLRERINAVTECILGLFVHRSNKIIMSDTTHSYTHSIQCYCCQWHECSGLRIFCFDITFLHSSQLPYYKNWCLWSLSLTHSNSFSLLLSRSLYHLSRNEREKTPLQNKLL